MQRTLESLLVRGVFGAVLSAAIVAGAWAQAMSLQGSVRLVDGRIQIDTSADSTALCATISDGGAVRMIAASRAEG